MKVKNLIVTLSLMALVSLLPANAQIKPELGLQDTAVITVHDLQAGDSEFQSLYSMQDVNNDNVSDLLVQTPNGVAIYLDDSFGNYSFAGYLTGNADMEVPPEGEHPAKQGMDPVDGLAEQFPADRLDLSEGPGSSVIMIQPNCSIATGVGQIHGTPSGSRGQRITVYAGLATIGSFGLRHSHGGPVKMFFFQGGRWNLVSRNSTSYSEGAGYGSSIGVVIFQFTIPPNAPRGGYVYLRFEYDRQGPYCASTGNGQVYVRS